MANKHTHTHSHTPHILSMPLFRICTFAFMRTLHFFAWWGLLINHFVDFQFNFLISLHIHVPGPPFGHGFYCTRSSCPDLRSHHLASPFHQFQRSSDPAIRSHGHIAIATGLYFTFGAGPFSLASVCLSVNVSIKFRVPRYFPLSRSSFYFIFTVCFLGDFLKFWFHCNCSFSCNSVVWHLWGHSRQLWIFKLAPFGGGQDQKDTKLREILPHVQCAKKKNLGKPLSCHITVILDCAIWYIERCTFAQKGEN